MKLNAPTFLTLFRLIISPIVIPFLVIYVLPMHSTIANILVGVLFLLFSLTDLLDGYLARRYGMVTQFGKILDLVADKFLIYSTLIALVAIHRVFFVWVLIFIGREFFIMGLRFLASEHEVSVGVSWWGKLKTLLQVLYVTVVIINPDYAQPWYATPMNKTETGLLVAALVMTCFSAYRYYIHFVSLVKNTVQEKDTTHTGEGDGI